MSGQSHDVEDSRLKEIESLVGQLVGRYQPDGSADREVEGDSIDRTLAGLRALVEVDVLRQLPKPRFQEILASAVSTEWYDNILNAIAEVLIVLGRTGRVQSVNRAAITLLGYEEEELIGRTLADIVCAEGPSLDRVMAEPEDGGVGAEPVRTAYRTSSGEKIPVDFSRSLVRDDQGNLRAVVCVARDVRLRIETERVLRETQQRYALAARGANDGLWEWAREAGSNYYSPRFAELLAYPESKVPPELELLDDLVHADDRERVLDAAGAHRRDGEPFDVECRLLSAKGEYRYFNLRGLGMFDENGTIIRIVGSARDITERKQTEELRTRFIERVISAEVAERRRIARELHDETGQSLTSVMVGLKAVESSIGEEDARERVAHLRSLTGRTLEEVGRLARGLHPSVLDDLGFATAIERYAAEYSKSHPVMVDVHLRGVDAKNRLPLVVETTLYRILQEALTNVAKHAEASTASIIVDRQKEQVRAIVEDDGRGFDLGANDGVTALDMSHGLGLHGIRERAALLKGWVTVESTPGMGTTLYVHIPLPEEPVGS